MILADLRSATTKCVLCAWFNEWHRFGERDQLSLSYVLHSMGLTPSPVDDLGAEPHEDERQKPLVHRGVYLWPRREHWNYKPRPGEPKPQKYVRYVGHGGCMDSGSKSKLLRNPGCP